MKKRIAVLSALAMLVASSGLFAFDILNSEGEKTGLSIDFTVHYRFNIDTTDEAESHSTSSSWVEEVDGDKQSKVKVGVGYEGDNYAFGTSITGERKYAASDVDNKLGLDVAWGKFYFLDKQFWIRAGSLGNQWSFDTDPYSGNWGDDGPGLQFNVSPAAVSGLSVGFSLPVPFERDEIAYYKDKTLGSEFITVDEYNALGTGDKALYEEVKGDWGPAYLFQNAKFGLKLDGTIPNLKFSTELTLKGVSDKIKEEKFNGMDTVIFVQYDIAPITIKAAAKIEDIGADATPSIDPLISAGARLIVALPTIADNLSLGSPWVQVKSGVQTIGKKGTLNADGKYEILRADRKSFTQTDINFEWDPSYKIIPDRLDFVFWLGVGYSIYDDPLPPQEDYPLEVSVRPGLKVSFAPNANFIVRDRIDIVRKNIEKGFKNSVQFLFECSL